jgi:hypothetical protein
VTAVAVPVAIAVAAAAGAPRLHRPRRARSLARGMPIARTIDMQRTTSNGTKPTHARGRGAAASRRKSPQQHHRSSHSNRTLVERDEIRNWAEQRGGKPAAVNGTSRSDDDVGMIRIEFEGASGEGSLEPIEWDDWFEKFDDSNLALIVQDKTSDGEISHFNKLVARAGSPRARSRTRNAKKRPMPRNARHH